MPVYTLRLTLLDSSLVESVERIRGIQGYECTDARVPVPVLSVR